MDSEQIRNTVQVDKASSWHESEMFLAYVSKISSLTRTIKLILPSTLDVMGLIEVGVSVVSTPRVV